MKKLIRDGDLTYIRDPELNTEECYDKKGNLIHAKYSNGYEVWYEYDDKGNCIYIRNSKGYEVWYEYDDKGNCIHKKYSNGDEYWYDNKGNCIRGGEW